MEINLPTLKSRDDYVWVIKEEFRSNEIYYKIEISANEIIGLLSIKSLADGNINTAEILNKIKSSKLTILDQTSLQYLLENIGQLKEVNNFVLSKGVAPKHGKDAKINIAYVPMEMHLPKNEVAKVDYKEIHKIVSVKEHDVLAVYEKETEGENGSDVYGQVITARKGKPTKFLASKNVVLDEATMTIRATVDGIPSSAHGIFKVDPSLIIENNVDLTVGNINFTGTVSINGDVLDGFKVQSGGDVFIKGVIGACEIISSGNVIVHGGIAGKGKCVIKCKELHAKFLHEALVEAEDKVIIQKEIIGSTIYCNDSLIAGVIIGGRIIVRNSLEVSVIGSEQNIETKIEIGVDCKILKQYEEALSKIPEIEIKLKKEIEILKPFTNLIVKFNDLPEEKQVAIKKIFLDFKLTLSERKELEIIFHNCLLGFRLDKHRKKSMLVLKLLHENVRFGTQFSYKKVTEALKGPLLVKEDLEKKSFYWEAPI
jgi:uncharacterized protein (DUF342 family)